MKYLLVIAIIFLWASSLNAQHIVINEVMYAPLKPEPEWIELFNPYDSLISLKGWTISDLLKSYPIPSTASISSKGYVLLTKDSASLANKYIAASLHIIPMTMPALNNTGDLILLKDSQGFSVDSMRFYPSWGGSNGRSLERIDYLAPSDSENFGNSISPLAATPGEQNSIRRRDFDLALQSLTYTTTDPNDLSLKATIVNKGRNTIGDGMVTIASHSGLPLSQAQIVAPILPLQKQEISLSWQNADYGRTTITAYLTLAQDEVRSNDSLETSLYLPIPRNAVIINEIMPLPASSSSQWIEIFNNSLAFANMDSSMFHISVGSKIYNFPIVSLSLAPKEYAVIGADSSFFTTFPFLRDNDRVVILNKSDLKLKDSGNQIILLNTDSSIIDSLHFYSSWYPSLVVNHSGISLERKFFSSPSTDPDNWSSSTDPSGSTPLRKNSDVDDSSATPTMIDVQISPNPFSPDGDGFNDVANISIALPSDKIEPVMINLYDLKGRLRRSIPLNQGVFRAASVRFDGKDDNGITLPIGLYTVVVTSPNGTFNAQRKGIVIIKKPR